MIHDVSNRRLKEYFILPATRGAQISNYVIWKYPLQEREDRLARKISSRGEDSFASIIPVYTSSIVQSCRYNEDTVDGTR